MDVNKDLEPSDLSELTPNLEELEVEKETDTDKSSLDQSSVEEMEEPLVEEMEEPFIEEEPIGENPNENMDLDKLNTFYYLKQKYEQDKRERCNKFALEKENANWKMKRAFFASKKPKCVNCKRKVGSEFSIKHIITYF